MIALELMIGGSYPSSGNGVTLAKFLESSSASFEAIGQPLNDYSCTGRPGEHAKESATARIVGDWWLAQEGTYLMRCTSSLHELLLVCYLSVTLMEARSEGTQT